MVELYHKLNNSQVFYLILRPNNENPVTVFTPRDFNKW